MTIKDLQNKLPIKVKLNSKFKSEESFDSGTIVLIKSITLVDECNDGNVYKLEVSSLKEDLKYNKTVCKPDWYNSKTGEYDYTYYEHHKPNSQGNYDDIIYVMNYDDYFGLLDDQHLYPKEFCIKFADYVNKNRYTHTMFSIDNLFNEFLKQQNK